jgi:multidrug efflux pump subunit AcrA (membrane-fusion protein)
MSNNQETMRSSINSAGQTAQAALATAESAKQATIDAAVSVVGYIPGFPTGNATYVAAVKAAALALQSSRAATEVAKQGAIEKAKDLLRSQGEIPF